VKVYCKAGNTFPNFRIRLPTFGIVRKGESRDGRVFIENLVKMREFNKADQPLKGSFRIGGGKLCKVEQILGRNLDRTIKVLRKEEEWREEVLDRARTIKGGVDKGKLNLCQSRGVEGGH